VSSLKRSLPAVAALLAGLLAAGLGGCWSKAPVQPSSPPTQVAGPVLMGAVAPTIDPAQIQPSTAYGRSLLAMADAAALRTSLAVGTGKARLLSTVAGTGTTDGFAAANTSAINTLLAAGSVVVADGGIYPVTQIVVPSVGKCGLAGYGPGTGFRSVNGANATMIRAGPADGIDAIYPTSPLPTDTSDGTRGSGFSIRDCVLDFNRSGNSTTGDPRGGNLAAANGNVVYRQTWWINGVCLHRMNDVLFDNVDFVESPTFGVLFQECSRSVTRNCRFYCANRGPAVIENQDCIHWNGGCSLHWVIGCRLQSNDDALAVNLAEGTGRPGYGFYFLGNHFDTCCGAVRAYGSEGGAHLLDWLPYPAGINTIDGLVVEGNTGDLYQRGVLLGPGQRAVDHIKSCLIAANNWTVRGDFCYVVSSTGALKITDNVIRPRGSGDSNEDVAAVVGVGDGLTVASIDVRGNTVYRDQTAGMSLGRFSQNSRLGEVAFRNNTLAAPLAGLSGSITYPGRTDRAAAVAVNGLTGQIARLDRLTLSDNDLHGTARVLTGSFADINELTLSNNRWKPGDATAARLAFTGATARVGRLISNETTGPSGFGPVHSVASGATVELAGGTDYLRDGPSLADTQLIPGYDVQLADWGDERGYKLGYKVFTADATEVADYTPVNVPAPSWTWLTDNYSDTGATAAATDGGLIAAAKASAGSHTWVQATAGSRPTHHAPVAVGRLPWVTFGADRTFTDTVMTGLSTGATPSTVAFWVKFSGADRAVVSWGDQSAGSTRVFGFFSGSVGVTPLGTSALAPGYNDGSWHWVCVTFDGTTLRTYVDGAYKTSCAGAGVGTGTLYPANYAGSYQTESIDIAEIAVWNGTRLSDAEVLSRYQTAARP
jgi:hypothetical protein